MQTRSGTRIAMIGGTVALAITTAAGAWAGEAVPLAPDRVETVGVNVAPVEYEGKNALRLTVKAGEGGQTERLAVLRDLTFADGTIEVDLSGAPAAGAFEGARGFVGVAFHVQEDRTHYECFYLRPTNGRADDQLRRNHSAQYISHPEYPWHRLRQETPGEYESYVDLVPGEWTEVRIVVSDRGARLFVHGATQPTLIVKDLKLSAAEGTIALWIGPGTVAHFANLRVTR
ncbi:MAG: hypothetical protein LJF15_07885 [Acidobacteria bacterium]|jgi:hypothetical protein|nr:hypothetical protein [Acidobacteriota bacterium]